MLDRNLNKLKQDVEAKSKGLSSVTEVFRIASLIMAYVMQALQHRTPESTRNAVCLSPSVHFPLFVEEF